MHQAFAQKGTRTRSWWHWTVNPWAAAEKGSFAPKQVNSAHEPADCHHDTSNLGNPGHSNHLNNLKPNFQTENSKRAIHQIEFPLSESSPQKSGEATEKKENLRQNGLEQIWKLCRWRRFSFKTYNKWFERNLISRRSYGNRYWRLMN